MPRLGATPKSWGDELVHLALFFQPQKASGDFSLLPNAKHGQAGQAGQTGQAGQAGPVHLSISVQERQHKECLYQSITHLSMWAQTNSHLFPGSL